MKIKRIIGIVFFALMGMLITVMVFYPYALEYLYLTDRPPKDFGIKEICLLSIAFVFFWGSAKFNSIANFIINTGKNRFNKSNDKPKS